MQFSVVRFILFSCITFIRINICVYVRCRLENMKISNVFNIVSSYSDWLILKVNILNYSHHTGWNCLNITFIQILNLTILSCILNNFANLSKIISCVCKMWKFKWFVSMVFDCTYDSYHSLKSKNLNMRPIDFGTLPESLPPTYHLRDELVEFVEIPKFVKGYYVAMNVMISGTKFVRRWNMPRGIQGAS